MLSVATLVFDLKSINSFAVLCTHAEQIVRIQLINSGTLKKLRIFAPMQRQKVQSTTEHFMIECNDVR